MTEEQRKLIEDNYPFYIYWFNIHNINDEDKEQELILTLCRYIHLYNPDESKFTTFVHNVFTTNCIKLSEYNHRSIRILNDISLHLDEPVFDKNNEDNDATITYADTIYEEEKGYDNVESKIITDAILSELPKLVDAHQLKVFMTWLDIGSYTKTAKIFNVSRQRIQQIVSAVQTKIKKKWKNPLLN